jgi:hypothetical protein
MCTDDASAMRVAAAKVAGETVNPEAPSSKLRNTGGVLARGRLVALGEHPAETREQFPGG